MVKDDYKENISFEGIVEANGLDEGILLKQEQDFHIDDSQIETKIRTDMFGYDLLPDKEMTYTLRDRKSVV